MGWVFVQHNKIFFYLLRVWLFTWNASPIAQQLRMWFIHFPQVQIQYQEDRSPSDSSSSKLCLFKIRIGETTLPAALMQHMPIVFAPLPPLLMAPSWRFPRGAKMLCAFSTLGKVVSATLKILVASKLQSSTVLPRNAIHRYIFPVETMCPCHKCTFRLTQRDFWMTQNKYDGRLKSSWTQLTTLSRNFVEVQW